MAAERSRCPGLVLLSITLSLLLMGATCWTWNKQRVDMLTLEQAVNSLSAGQDTTLLITQRWKSTVRALRKAAERDDALGRHAQHALNVLRQEMNR